MATFNQSGQHVGGDQYNADHIVINEPSPPVAPSIYLHQLPPDEFRFTGRVSDIAEVLACIEQADADHGAAVAISAIAGMAGVGKSTLAIHAAHTVKQHFPDAQLYIDLRGADGAPLAPLDVLGRFLQSLGVDDQVIPAGLQDRVAWYRSLLATT